MLMCPQLSLGVFILQAFPLSDLSFEYIYAGRSRSIPYSGFFLPELGSLTPIKDQQLRGESGSSLQADSQFWKWGRLRLASDI